LPILLLVARLLEDCDLQRVFNLGGEKISMLKTDFRGRALQVHE
jgi:hypothetical protein